MSRMVGLRASRGHRQRWLTSATALVVALATAQSAWAVEAAAAAPDAPPEVRAEPHAREAPPPVLQALARLAESGHAEAQYLMGMELHLGRGVGKDHAQALRWFERADAGGDGLGAFKRACYLAGQCEGGPALDLDAATAAMARAAEAGYARAQLAYAGMRFRAGDVLQARQWTQRAADQGNQDAMRTLASFHKGGHGGAPDQAAAYLWAERSLGEGERTADVARQLGLLWSLLSPSQQDWVQQQRDAGWQPRPTALTLRARAGHSRVLAVLRESMR